MLTMLTVLRVGRYPAVLLMLSSAGCASATPPQPQVEATQPTATQPAAAQPAAAQPAAAQPAATQSRGAAVAAARPTPAAPVRATPKPAAPALTSPPAAPAPIAAATLDLDALTARLKATKAIGVFTKISLKNKVDDLMQRFSEHYQGKKPPIAELRLSYDLLMMKVLTLLQNEDEALASAVVSSREAIWALLADEKTFTALHG